MAWCSERHRRSSQRWNARLNAWARRSVPPPAVEPSFSGSSDGKLDSRAASSARTSPRADDELTTVLIAELRRLQQLVERGSAGATDAC